MTKPRDQGFKMPPEWAPHSRCWMAWPCREDMWADRLDGARRVTADVAKAIAAFEPVTMIARPELMAGVSLYGGARMTVLPLAQDDSWTRDTCPTFLVDERGGIAGITWEFNGWGELQESYTQDAQMAKRVLEHQGLPIFKAPLVLEGGAIHVDGAGTCLVCEPSVLDPKRNPGMSRDQVDTILADYLGVSRTIWLPFGLVDDETRGHIDNVACFARPGLLLVHAADDKADANYEPTQANLEVLRSAVDAQGRALELVLLPQPKARARHDGSRLTLSYVNFYLANGGVVIPAFGDTADTPAFKTISQAFPDRRVIQIDVAELLEGGGGIHCITQQQPEPVAAPAAVTG